MTVYKSVIPELKLRRADGQIHKVKITSAEAAANYFREIFGEEMLEICEQFMVIYLNNANNTIGWFKASQGGISGTVVDPRLVFKKAIDCYATSMIICHNHPSGKLQASNADKDITKKLREAGKFLDINLLDHIILAPVEPGRAKNYFSFQDEGIF